MSLQYFAHSLQNSDGSPRPLSEWEPLFTGTGEGHLEKVATLAAEFADKFNAADWGRVAGLWHDLGKYSAEFQAYLRKENGFEAHLEQYNGRVDHSTAGAKHAVHAFVELGQPEVGRILAYCIAGHHAGLADADAPPGEGARGLNQRLAKIIPDYSAAPEDTLLASRLTLPAITISGGDKRRVAYQISLFCRMLFSCLVDADFLATESFMSRDKARLRPKSQPPMNDLEQSLNSYLEVIVARAERSSVFDCRQEILAACHNAATQEPGLFSLTVPTGGGKTLSSLAFGLRHAQQYGLERVIYAIPFTSIIEQTADVFREVFEKHGKGIVLEHHTNLDPDDKHETKISRLAIENWDSPIVVTTNVQLFESLFASRTSKCRKLHRIARSVIVLDEAQILPIELLKPCLAVLRELATDYGCSIVLCTATQPAIIQRDDFRIGLEGVREIISDSAALHRRMKRVIVKSIGRLTDCELVEQLSEHNQFLCIVNTRPHAVRICELLRTASPIKQQDELFHLSTFMCGAHRSQVIRVIRERLNDGKSCRVVSTQLIEAGVDIDFPAVYRARDLPPDKEPVSKLTLG